MWYAKACCFKFGRKGIRVMTVSPGVIKTQMSMEDFKKSLNLNNTIRYSGLGRTGTAEEAAFLFSTILDERNSLLTGTHIYLDGGCCAGGYHGQREPRDSNAG